VGPSYALSTTWERDSQRELLPEVHDEVARLPEKYRVPIVLCYVEGLTHEEAAGQLHLPVGTVKVRLARGQLVSVLFLTKTELTPIICPRGLGDRDYPLS
jgi:DNA-directed RNA polymerase specialized sigma24 family protein